MIRLFSSNKSYTAIFLVLLAFLLHLVLWQDNNFFVLKPYPYPLYQVILNFIQQIFNNHFSSLALFSMGLVLLQAFIINRFVNTIKLFPKPNYLTGLMYLVCSCLFKSYLYFSPVLIVNTFIILVLIKLYQAYQKVQCYQIIFDIGLLIGISSLIYFPSIALMLLFFIGMSLFRPFIWREWVIGCFGFLAPFLIALTFAYWNDKLSLFFLNTIETIFDEYIVKIQIEPDLIWINAQLVLIVGISIYFLQNNFLKSQIQFRKFLSLMLWSIIILLFSSLLISKLYLSHFLILSAPLSIIMTYFFMNFKKWHIPELIFEALLISIFIFQYIT